MDLFFQLSAVFTGVVLAGVAVGRNIPTLMKNYRDR